MEGVVLQRVDIFGLFCPNWVRVSNAQWHHYTQTWVKCSPHPSTQELTCSQHIGPYCSVAGAMQWYLEGYGFNSYHSLEIP